MIRFREDIDGCGCLRCQGVDREAVRRSIPDALVWSGRLLLARPSILLVFAAVGLAHLLAIAGSGRVVVVGALASFLGALVARGYVAVTGEAVIREERVSPIATLRTVFRRLPAVVGATLLLAGIVTAGAATVMRVVVPAIQRALDPAAVGLATVRLAALVFVVVWVLYALVKFCVFPEACFVGGYGPVAALRASWRVTTLHTAKAVAIVAGFVALLGVGVLLDTQLADPASPVALSFRYGETSVVLRSFGFSLAGGVRFVFDIVVTAIYAGVFLHQYVGGVFDG